MDAWERTFEIKKLNDEQRLVFGVLSKIVNEDGSPVVDSQGDIIPIDELEKAAYEHVVESRRADQMHDGVTVGELVESFVSTPEKRAAQGVEKADDHSVYWWVGYRVRPEVFAKVKAGELRAFSIGGSAVRGPVDKDCGTGAGGFKEGNTCARGDGDGGGGGGDSSGSSTRGGSSISDTDPASMTPGQINRELDRLDKETARLADVLVAEGHGSVPHSELRRIDSDTARRYLAVSDRQNALRAEIRERYGPGAPRRLPTHGRQFERRTAA